MPFIDERTACWYQNRGYHVDITYDSWEPSYRLVLPEPVTEFKCPDCKETWPVSEEGWFTNEDGESLCLKCTQALIDKLKAMPYRCRGCGGEVPPDEVVWVPLGERKMLTAHCPKCAEGM